MNIISRIKRKYNYLLDKRYFNLERKAIMTEIVKSKDKNLFLFSVPTHSNLGDQAQYFCWLRLFNRYYPDYNIISVAALTSTDEILNAIKQNSSSEDKFFIHSGYLIYDPHPELPFIFKVVNKFHDHHITILPQTINLISKKRIKETADCFNAHPNLTIISRDEVSLQNANRLFPCCTRLLWPDVVTSLIGDSEFQYDGVQRDGIMFCVRNDGEKYYSEEQINELKCRFRNVKVTKTDTTITLPKRCWDRKRGKLIRNVIADFARYQLVITDRYHGTIFSQIANTPVIVINSTDHKLSSGIKWFPNDEFGENVFFAKNLDEAYNIAQTVLARNGSTKKNPSWFMDNYYSKMI